jgi:dTDP-4-dehydrorhamnose reductase
MRVLVTGARGMLGTDVCSEFRRRGHEVIEADIAEFDIADAQATHAFATNCRPGLIVHCAAFTDVDGCERTPEIAFRVNATGSESIAVAANSVGARLIAISTDFVFDGEKREPYAESDPMRPLSVYGKSKAEGEDRVRKRCANHQIVRTSWLYGRHGKCFPQTILAAARSRSELRVVSDQTGCPTFAGDLASALAELATIDATGTFHVSNSEPCTWFEFARFALDQAGREDVTVTPIASSEWPTPAVRPKYSVLGPYRWIEAGKKPLRGWRDAYLDYAGSSR